MACEPLDDNQIAISLEGDSKNYFKVCEILVEMYSDGNVRPLPDDGENTKYEWIGPRPTTLSLNEVKKELYMEKPVARLINTDRAKTKTYQCKICTGQLVTFSVPFTDGSGDFDDEMPAQLLIKWIVEDTEPTPTIMLKSLEKLFDEPMAMITTIDGENIYYATLSGEQKFKVPIKEIGDMSFTGAMCVDQLTEWIVE